MIVTQQTYAPTFSTLSDRELVVSLDFDAPRKLVWEAWSQPTHLAKWLLGPEGWTMPICEMDLRAGGKWRFGWRKSDGEELFMEGEYREVLMPELLVYTERWGSEWPETLNTISFTETHGITTMTVRMRYPSNEARAAAMATGMTEGMAMSFNRLGAYLHELQS